MLLRTRTGNINLRNASGQVRIFHVPHKGGMGNQEVFLSQAAKNGPTQTVVKQVGSPAFFSSLSGVRQEVGGRCVDQIFDIAEGEIVKVFVDVRANYGKRPTRGAVYLRMREGAAQRVLDFAVTNNPRAMFTSGTVEGTFDILTLADLADAGVKIAPHLKPLSTETAVKKVMKQTILREEIKPRTIPKKSEVVTVRGQKRDVVVSAKPRRRLGS
jgi:hypothetical protein